MEYYEVFSPDNQQEPQKPKQEEYIKLKEHKSKLKKTALVTVLVTSLLATGFGLGLKSAGYLGNSPKTIIGGQLPANGIPAAAAVSLEGENSIRGIVERTGGAVVAIETESQVQNPWSGREDIRRFFGGTAFPEQQQTVQGLGSGFIISAAVHFVTNNQGIAGGSSIRVQLLGEEEPLTAKVVGTDEELDLAVLKIETAKQLPVVPLGNSEQISVGDWVVAIGNPYGLDHTVTMGVISAKGRPLTIEDNHFKNLLQTDASINPGNSGGPLLNLKGEVIGINTAVNTAGQGLGFAIPINTVQEVLQQLIDQGKVTRPWLGVSILDMTQEIADYLQMEYIQGVAIAGVVKNSPAAKAGLQQGDIILAINGQKVTKSEEVTNLVGKSKIGDTIQLKIIRNKAEQTITATLAEK